MTIASLPFSGLLAGIAAKTPSPGGGAVACASGALAAALAHMVVAYSIGKKNLLAHQAELESAAASLKRLQGILVELGDEDAQAYSLVNELMKLPETDPRRARELPGALDASIQIPMAAIAACDDLLRLCERLAPITNVYLHSDLAIAAVLGESAARASRWNVAVNVAQLPDEARRTRTLAEADRSLADAAARREAVERACRH
ncbi:MAG: cyclodeaminase/cyclohydrolase family protein [Phycisphaeraceae bacterium]|nr:cyclodeaminase/cyclohydrolase family protein [Phycisphaeraceae bacterium]